MRGIDLNQQIILKHASMRYFSPNEWHATRFCKDDVLLLVFEGVLRFKEDGVFYEIHPGEYHIQKNHTFQEGYVASDTPQYLYVHFLAEWAEDAQTLPYCGNFDYAKLKPLMEEMDRLSHSNASLLQKSSKFFELLLMLQQRDEKESLARKIAAFISREELSSVSLDNICKEFHFSKNHIINIFKREYGITPVDYINRQKIKRAKHLLEATSNTAEQIARESGFRDYSHFYRLFCRENGISPMEWRNRKQLQPTLEI